MNNYNFIFFGNSKKSLRYWLWIISSLTVVMPVYAQTSKLSSESFESKIQDLKRNNDVENFTYAFIDQYRAQPSEDNLSLFETYEKTIWRTYTTKEEYLSYVILLCNKAYYLTRFGEIHEAIEVYEKAWTIFDHQHLVGFDIIEYCLKPLANDYSMLGDYSSAGNIVKNYLFLAEKEKNTQHVISALINLSIIYHDTGKSAEAIKILQEAQAIRPITPKQLGLIYSGFLRNYTTLHDFPKAKHYGMLAVDILKMHRENNSFIPLMNVYQLLATVSLEEQNQEKALAFIKKAQQLASSSVGIMQNRERAKLINSYAEIMKLKKEYSRALASYLESISILLPNYKPHQNTLPDISTLYAENTLKETFDGLADVYLKMNQPGLALACYELSFAVEDLLRKTYSYEEAKLLQQIENRNRTEMVLTVLYNLFLQTKDKKFAVQAFQVAERTKAITLKENIDNQYIRKSIKSDTLIKKENALRYRLATLNNKIAIEQMEQSHADVTRINDLILEQTKTTIALKEIEGLISKKYYVENQSHFFDSLDVHFVHLKLKKDKAILIEYFSGKNSLFVFTLNSTTVDFKRINDLPDLKKKIIELDDLFSNVSAINNEIERYKNLAFELYEILNLSKESTIKNLILIPDGLLHLIPFDALLYEKCEGVNYSSFPYLLKKHSIAYQTSAFIYSNTNQVSISINKKKLLAIFPVFENTARELNYSPLEADGIHQYIEGKYLYKQDATRKAFLQNANQYSIIHLSTHASTGNAPEPPSITFIDSTLYLPQIYGLQITADLLVLSACETGAGLLVKGEGPISLARGFQFAGVQNLIFSLWRVNDYSTAALMINFYSNYAATGSKAESLRLAKLDYLADNNISNDRKSPYYWAGFVYYGNVAIQPLKTRREIILTLSATFAFILILILIGIYIRKNHFI